jgi:hypothetical protein
VKKYGNVQEIIYADESGKLSLGDATSREEQWITDDTKSIEEFYNSEDELA